MELCPWDGRYQSCIGLGLIHLDAEIMKQLLSLPICYVVYHGTALVSTWINPAFSFASEMSSIPSMWSRISWFSSFALSPWKKKSCMRRRKAQIWGEHCSMWNISQALPVFLYNVESWVDDMRVATVTIMVMYMCMCLCTIRCIVRFKAWGRR